MRRLALHAFTQFGWPDGNDGLWRNPEWVPPRSKPDLAWWSDLVRVAERGCMDAVFFADSVGLPGSDPDRTIRQGELILWDPAVAIPALAAATEELGFLFTSSVLQDHPLSFARKASTLDQLTDGRVGWNIVTSYSSNAARNFGMDDLPPREERYRWADEYVDVTYRLWEGSWEEDAVIADAAAGTYVDSSKVHKIDYSGERYRVEGPHLTPATPQRTPLLVQAGGSPAGRAFAAKHAEVQFVVGQDTGELAEDITGVRKLAVQAGRRPEDISFTLWSDFVIGSTEAEARRKADEFVDYGNFKDKVAEVSAAFGVDFTGLEPDAPVLPLLEDVTLPEASVSGVLNQMIRSLPKDRTPTLRDLVRSGSGHGHVVGTPEQIADQLEGWQAAGVDGVCVGLTTRPGALVEFVDEVIPVLQERGIAQQEYGPGTLREKIMGYGPRLPQTHPAARYRR